jgi:hypothetical protein
MHKCSPPSRPRRCSTPSRSRGPASHGPRGAAVAAALRQTRQRFARVQGPDFDVVDPIEGPFGVHADVVDQIAAALGHITRILDGRGIEASTVRMPRLPPVPNAS